MSSTNRKLTLLFGEDLWGLLPFKRGGGGSKYRLIDPIDPVAFPTYTGLKVLTLDGTEDWKASGGAVYTSDFAVIIKNQSRASVVGFCADYIFEPSVQGIASMSDDAFIFNGTSSIPVNGNLSFKNDNTTSTSAWATWLAEHPLTILISTNAPDTSVWKPAVRNSDGITGYWDGADGFCAVNGGIPYYGENLVTDEHLVGKYTNAWISTAYAFVTASSSTSVVVPVKDGAHYKAVWDSVDSSAAGTIYRYGFTDDPEPKSGNTLTAPRARSTPQDDADLTLAASGDYLVIQVASGTYPENLSHLSVREMIGYTEPPMLMGGYRPPEPEPEPDEEGEEQ